jgi:hypothetical protein
MMRSVLVAAVLVLAVFVPALAAQVDPKALVLPQSELPEGFQLVKGQSGVRSNARRATDYPADRRPRFDRFGRLTGYQAVYWRRNPTATLVTSADLFRRAEGVDRFVTWYQQQFREPGGQAPKVTRAWIGARATVATNEVAGKPYTTVSWRHGRVIAAVVGQSVPTATVLRLARVQQRRIAAALR